MEAVRQRRMDLVSQWIEAGADMDAVHREVRPVAVHISISPLVHAIETQNAPMVKLLLSKGASPNPITGRATTNSPMTQWLVSVSRTPYMTQAQEDIGLALFEAGGDLKKGLAPEGSASLYDVLKQTGKLAKVDHLELRFLAEDMARELEKQAPAPKAASRRIKI